MRVGVAGSLLLAVVLAVSVQLRATPARDPGNCPRDTKLIGQVSVFGDEFEASWWQLIFNGMVAGGLTTPNAQRDYLNGVFGTAFGTLAVVLVSALEIRFGPHFRRDDYRSAAAVARTALDAGEKVWWLADVSTGRYYHVPFGSPQLTVTPDLSGPVTTPDLVIFSKPDIYDSSDAVRHYLTANGFTVTQIQPAFEILKRSPVR